MPFLTLNKLTVPVQRGSATGAPDTLGNHLRAVDGSLVSFSRAFKWTQNYEAVLSRDDAYSLIGLLSGRGDIWSFDADLFSGKGLGPHSSSTVTGITAGGKFGSAVVVSGTSRLSFPAHDFGVTEGTVALWAYVGLNTFNATRKKLFWHAFNSYNRVMMEVGADDRWLAVVGNGSIVGHHLYIDNSSTLTPVDTWAHFCLTWSKRRISFYVNGVERGSVSSPAYLPESKNTVIDLGHTGGAEQYGDKLDELLVLPYQASQNMVSAIYNYGAPFPNAPVLVTTGDAVPSRMLTRGIVESFEHVTKDRIRVRFQLLEQ